MEKKRKPPARLLLHTPVTEECEVWLYVSGNVTAEAFDTLAEILGLIKSAYKFAPAEPEEPPHG